MKWVELAKTLLSLLPAIITAIKAIEEALPATGQGAAKLALIREIIESVSGELTEIWPYVEKVISLVVSWFNKTGVFKTSAI